MVPFKHISSKLTALVVLVVVIPVTVLLLIIGAKFMDNVRELSLNGVADQVHAEKQRAVTLLNIAKNEVEVMAQNLEEYLAVQEDMELELYSNLIASKFYNEGSFEFIAGYFYKTISKYEHYLQIRIIHANGNEILRFDRSGPGITKTSFNQLQNKSSAEYFKHIRRSIEDEIHVRPISLNKEYNKIISPHVPMLLIGKRVMLKNGKVFGMIVLNVHAGMFFTPLLTSEESGFLVIDQEGTYIHHWNKNILYGKDLGHKANLLTEEPELKTNLQKADSRIHYDPELKEFRVWEKVFFDIERNRYWVFMNRQPESAILGSWYSIARTGAIGLFAVLFISFLIFIFLSRRLLTPLGTITSAIEKMEKGELSVRADISSTDEIGDIARMFNTMAESLETSHEQLEIQVEERTKELSDANAELNFQKFALDEHAIVSATDVKGNITYMNDKFCDISGYPRDELIGKNHRIVKSDEHPPEFYRDLWRTISNGKPWHGEVQNNRKGGGYYWVKVTIVPFMDQRGKPFQYLAIRTDITERKLAEEEIKKSEAQIKLLLNSMGEAIYGLDMNGDCTFLNQSCMEILGYQDEDQLLGINMHKLIHHTRKDGTPYPVTECKIYKAFQNEEGIRVDDEVLWRADGTSFAAEYRSFPSWRDGKVTGSVVTFTDITERKENEVKLKETKEEAEKANKAKSVFLSSMSHELRTPLNSILGFSQLLSTDTTNPLTESQKDFTFRIIKSGNHLLELIDEVLDLSKIEAGKLSISLDDIELKPVILESIMSISPLAEKRGIQINYELDDECVCVRADLTRLRQVILNFLSNAVKYNRENGEVKLWCEPLNDETMRIIVEDTGYGIAEEKIGPLFEPFNRMGAESSNIEGTGIGMTITKRLIEAMNGRIGVESEVGKGTRFFVDLPRGRKMN